LIQALAATHSVARDRETLRVRGVARFWGQSRRKPVASSKTAGGKGPINAPLLNFTGNGVPA
jgi:hypothetical protein